jgi:hypothetical protein
MHVFPDLGNIAGSMTRNHPHLAWPDPFSRHRHPGCHAIV